MLQSISQKIVKERFWQICWRGRACTLPLRPTKSKRGANGSKRYHLLQWFLCTHMWVRSCSLFRNSVWRWSFRSEGASKELQQGVASRCGDTYITLVLVCAHAGLAESVLRMLSLCIRSRFSFTDPHSSSSSLTVLKEFKPQSTGPLPEVVLSSHAHDTQKALDTKESKET